METEEKQIRVGDLVRMGLIYEYHDDELHWGKVISVGEAGVRCQFWTRGWASEYANSSLYPPEQVTVVEPFKKRIKSVNFGRVPGGSR